MCSGGGLRAQVRERNGAGLDVDAVATAAGGIPSGLRAVARGVGTAVGAARRDSVLLVVRVVFVLRPVVDPAGLAVETRAAWGRMVYLAAVLRGRAGWESVLTKVNIWMVRRKSGPVP